MAQSEHTPRFAVLEEALIILFCQVDDIYYQLNPRGGHYASLKQLSDSEILTLTLFQQLRGVESERSFLREVVRFFSHLFPGVVGLHPSSFAPSRAQTEALPGALAACHRARTGGRARDLDRRLYAA